VNKVRLSSKIFCRLCRGIFAEAWSSKAESRKHIEYEWYFLGVVGNALEEMKAAAAAA
jgi:hypothetical protein